MTMSTLIKTTQDQKAAEKATVIENAYNTVLNTLTNNLQGAEFLPGGLLKLSVAASVGDAFAEAIKNIGSDVLRLVGRSLWRSSVHANIIYCEGLDPRNVDDDWESIINDLKLRVEML